MSQMIDRIFERDAFLYPTPWTLPPRPVSPLTPEARFVFDRQTRAVMKSSAVRLFQLREELSDAQIITIHNVSKYLDEAGVGPDQIRELPNLAPPFRKFWMEYRLPVSPIDKFDAGTIGLLFIALDQGEVQEGVRQMIEGQGSSPEDHVRKLHRQMRVGWDEYGPDIEAKMKEFPEDWITKVDPQEMDVLKAFHAWNEASEALAKGVSAYHDYIREMAAMMVEMEDRWVVTATLYSMHGKSVVGPVGSWHFGVSETGRRNSDVQFSLTYPSEGVQVDRDFQTFFPALIDPALFAIALMHCKNVVLVEHEADEKVQRKRQRHGKKPLIRYSTLNIEPFQTVVRKARKAAGEKTTEAQALHICRGHFKHFGEEYGSGKLFGKHEGTYWWADRLKGSAEAGIIRKEYNVEDPEKVGQR